MSTVNTTCFIPKSHSSPSMPMESFSTVTCSDLHYAFGVYLWSTYYTSGTMRQASSHLSRSSPAQGKNSHWSKSVMAILFHFARDLLRMSVCPSLACLSPAFPTLCGCHVWGVAFLLGLQGWAQGHKGNTDQKEKDSWRCHWVPTPTSLQAPA